MKAGIALSRKSFTVKDSFISSPHSMRITVCCRRRHQTSLSYFKLRKSLFLMQGKDGYGLLIKFHNTILARKLAVLDANFVIRT